MILSLRILGTEAAVATANAFNGASTVRVYNNNGADVLLTITKADTTTQTVTIRTGETLYVQKQPADTIAAGTSCRMVGVAQG
jgi:hypothetical protein